MERLTALSLRWPWTTLLISVLLAALGAWGGASVPVSAGAYAYIGADHTAVTEFESFIETSCGACAVIVGMMASSFQTLADIGRLSAAAITAALLTELIVPPALLTCFTSRAQATAGVPACTV